MFLTKKSTGLKYGVLALGLSLLSCVPNLSVLDGVSSVDSSLSTLAQTGNTQVPFALYPMAWDGEHLWQYITDEEGPRLISQNLLTQTGKQVIVKSNAIPQHRSMAFGQGHLWLLDNKNTLYQLSLKGELVKTLTLQEMPAIFGAEAVAWQGDELWVVHKTYLSPENKVEPPRFFQIDPKTGKPLQTVIANEEGFRSFSHQNFYADATTFYLVRTSIFLQKENTLYKIDKQTGKVSPTPLKTQVTGMPTLFLHKKKLYSIELLELDDACGALCSGRLLNLEPSASE